MTFAGLPNLVWTPTGKALDHRTWLLKVTAWVTDCRSLGICI